MFYENIMVLNARGETVQFNDITKMVQDIWSFAWPPLAIVVIAYFMAYYFHPQGTNKLLHKIVTNIKKYSKKLEIAHSLIEPYGLTKLVPAISLVVLVACMYLINGPISSLVDNMPPQIHYYPDIVIEKHLSENRQLALLRKYPMADSVSEAYFVALEDVKPNSKTDPANKRANIWYQILLLLKFSFLFAIIMFFISIKSGLSLTRQFARLLITLSIITTLWISSCFSLLIEQNQDFYDEERLVVYSLIKDSPSLMAPPITKEEKEKLTPTWFEKDQRWWDISF